MKRTVDSMTIGRMREAVKGFFDRADDVPIMLKMPDGTLLELETYMYQQGPILLCAKPPIEEPPRQPLRVVK